MVQAFIPPLEPTAPKPISLEDDSPADHEDVADMICDLLKAHCLAQNLPYVPKRSKLVAVGSQESKVTARRADIVVLDRATWEGMKGLSSSAMAYTPPPLVIEVVSTNWRDDYLTKLAEHEAIGVQKYWIADYVGLGGVRYLGRPKRPMLSIYAMDSEETEYGEPLRFRGDELIASQVLAGLSVTADQILGGIAG